MFPPHLRRVLEEFVLPGPVVRAEPLVGTGGFSGALLWRVSTSAGDYALRRWPAGHPTPQRLAFIHSFQRHLSDSGLPFIPILAGARDGSTFIEHDDWLWELATWMPGEAGYRQHPSPARLAAAMTALARIHLAAQTMPGQSSVGTSPGLTVRLEQLRELRSGGMERIERAIARRPLLWDELARRICQRFRHHAPIEQQLADAARISGPLFPCLRDIWHDHVLFVGDEVTGVIDFGAARIESPAGDFARLVGSLVGDDREGWHVALAAYQTLRPLDADQIQLIRAFDASGVLLAGINWLTWLYVEERTFDDAEAVTRRLAEIVMRLNLGFAV